MLSNQLYFWCIIILFFCSSLTPLILIYKSYQHSFAILEEKEEEKEDWFTKTNIYTNDKVVYKYGLYRQVKYIKSNGGNGHTHSILKELDHKQWVESTYLKIWFR